MKGSLSKSQRNKNLLTVLFAVIAILYIMPIVIVLINSFKLSLIHISLLMLPIIKSRLLRLLILCLWPTKYGKIYGLFQELRLKIVCTPLLRFSSSNTSAI